MAHQSAVFHPEDRGHTFFLYCGLQVVSTIIFSVLASSLFRPRAPEMALARTSNYAYFSLLLHSIYPRYIHTPERSSGV